MGISARTYSDDQVVSVPFDAQSGFAQASDTGIGALAACGWGGNYPADAVAQWMSDVDPAASLFRYLELVNERRAEWQGPCGFACYVDDDAALAWLKTARKALYATLPAVTTVGAEV